MARHGFVLLEQDVEEGRRRHGVPGLRIEREPGRVRQRAALAVDVGKRVDRRSVRREHEERRPGIGDGPARRRTRGRARSRARARAAPRARGRLPGARSARQLSPRRPRRLRLRHDPRHRSRRPRSHSPRPAATSSTWIATIPPRPAPRSRAWAAAARCRARPRDGGLRRLRARHRGRHRRVRPSRHPRQLGRHRRAGPSAGRHGRGRLARSARRSGLRPGAGARGRTRLRRPGQRCDRQRRLSTRLPGRHPRLELRHRQARGARPDTRARQRVGTARRPCERRLRRETAFARTPCACPLVGERARQAEAPSWRCV